MAAGVREALTSGNHAQDVRCSLAPQAASDRVAELLAHEGVKFERNGFSIASTSTPIAVLGIDQRMYTRRNWVGINPFAYVSGVVVSCEPADGSKTKVAIQVNRRRAILWFVFWLACASLVGRAMPEPGGVILFAGVAVAAWFGVVSFLGGYLVKTEIGKALGS